MFFKGVVAIILSTFLQSKNSSHQTSFLSSVSAYEIKNDENMFDIKRNLQRRKLVTLIGDGKYDRVGQTISLSEVGIGSFCGFDVDITNDGRTIIVGCPKAGVVRLYRLITNETGDEWVSLESLGGPAFAETGHSVVFARDANIFAIGEPGFSLEKGRVRVFQLTQNGSIPIVTKLGDNIVGNAEDDSFGESIDITGDGKKIIIGAPNNNAGGKGYAKIYSLNGNTWTLEKKLSGDAVGERFGSSVAITKTGHRVIVGASGANDSAGRAIVYDVSQAAASEIYELVGEGTEKAGSSVGISGDGLHAAVGSQAYKCQSINDNCGRAHLVALDGSPFRTIIEGNTGERCGRSVELSDFTLQDGTFVVGCRGKVIVATHKGNGTFDKKVLLTNNNSQDFFGNAVALSSTRQALIVGAPGSPGSDLGNVQIFGSVEEASQSPSISPTVSKAPIGAPTKSPIAAPTQSPVRRVIPTAPSGNGNGKGKGKGKSTSKGKSKKSKGKGSSTTSSTRSTGKKGKSKKKGKDNGSSTTTSTRVVNNSSSSTGKKGKSKKKKRRYL